MKEHPDRICVELQGSVAITQKRTKRTEKTPKRHQKGYMHIVKGDYIGLFPSKISQCDVDCWK